MFVPVVVDTKSPCDANASAKRYSLHGPETETVGAGAP